MPAQCTTVAQKKEFRRLNRKQHSIARHQSGSVTDGLLALLYVALEVERGLVCEAACHAVLA